MLVLKSSQGLFVDIEIGITRFEFVLNWYLIRVSINVLYKLRLSISFIDIILV